MPNGTRGIRSSTTRRTAKRTGSRLWGIGAGVVAALTLAGLAIPLISGEGSPSTSTSPTHLTAKPEGAERTVQISSGVPTGHPRSETGAKAAAANYVVVAGSARFLTSEHARHGAIAVMASDNSVAAVTGKADHLAKRAATALKGGNAKSNPTKAIARTGVLSAHILGFDIHKATVRLWTTTVRGNAGGHVAPQGAFQSVTVDLIWESNDWKMVASSEEPGLVAPVDFRQSANVTRDFADYVPALAADPIVSGAARPDGFPAPYERTQQGARAAATSAAMLYGDPRFFTNTDWRHKMLASTAAPGILATTKSETDATARLVSENRGLSDDGRTIDGGLLVTRTAVLATRSISYSDQAASVELWTASVGGIAGGDETQRPQVAFLRMTVDLTWIDGTWKTTAVTPSDPLVPAPASAVQVTPADRFTQVGGVNNAPSTA